MKKLLFLLFSLTTTIVFAQRPEGGGNRGGGQGGFAGSPKIGRLYGKIIDPETQKGVGYASVTLNISRGKKDSVVAGALTEENGDFNLTALGFGRYKLKVSFLGFKDFSRAVMVAPPDNVEQDLGDIMLELDAKSLAEVNVNAEKSQSQLALDKQVFNVGRNAGSVGGTAEDVLKAVPSVTLDADGNAKLRNNGTTVYLDGRPTQLTLNQIPADQIEKVEIITNPSSKYEAQTSGGIINIISKQNKKPGYNGFVTLGVATGDRYNGTFSLSAKQGKWNFTSLYNRNQSQQPSNGFTHRTNLYNGKVSNYFDQNNTSKFDNHMQNAMASLEYQVNNRNTLTLGGAYRNGMHNMLDNQNYTIKNAQNETLINGTRTIVPNNEFTNFSSNLTWKKTYPKKDKSLITDIMLNRGFSDNAALWTTSETLQNSQINLNKNLISGGNVSKGGVFQLDYTNPLNDSTKLETGIRSSWNQRDQQYYNDLIDEIGKTKRLSDFTQDFLLNDVINAAYINYASKMKNGIAYQAGFRYEQSNLNADSRIAGKNFGYNYPSSASDILKAIFPSVYFSKKLKNNSEIQLNLSRKINRPDWMKAMPVIRVADRQNVQIGNASLKPEFITLAELNYNKLFGSHNLLISTYIRNEENVIVPFSYPSVADTSVLINTFVNGKNSFRYGLDNTLKLEYNKKLEITTNINVFNMIFKAENIDVQGYAMNAKINGNYKFPKDFSMQLSGNYESPRVFLQGKEAANYFADMSIKKDITLKEIMPSKASGGAGNARVGSLVFSVSDIFDTKRNLRYFETAYFTQDIQRRRDTRFFKITLQVFFGKPDASIFKKRTARPQGGGGMEEF
jgi:Outer membrane protein beta-barrel family/Carboxypeptidase regulatory-like domain/TonB-dependent Receptor Plug Domain